MEVYEYPGYRCGPCPPGLQGNGTHCADIDEVGEGRLERRKVERGPRTWGGCLETGKEMRRGGHKAGAKSRGPPGEGHLGGRGPRGRGSERSEARRWEHGQGPELPLVSPTVCSRGPLLPWGQLRQHGAWLPL